MRLSDFDYELPPGRIAEHPVSPRDAAKLLVVEDAGAFHDRVMRDLPDLLNPGDLLVFNDSKVIPARLYGMRRTAKVEVLLHKRRPDGGWEAFAKPGKRLQVNDEFKVSPDLWATVTAKLPDGQCVLHFNLPDAAFFAALTELGHMPLPPYIRKGVDSQTDAADYQTLYARHDGSVAAPTAGLHFTEDLLARLAARGIEHAFVTLHVGGGTFLPVKTENLDEHVMHTEWFSICAEAATRVNTTKARGGRVVAVGTTSVRTLESAADEAGVVHAASGETGIFIRPGYRFKVVDAMVTNFHLPKSTLLMLVSAFAGVQTMRRAYEHAIANGYRFFSYGDGSLLLRNANKA